MTHTQRIRIRLGVERRASVKMVSRLHQQRSVTCPAAKEGERDTHNQPQESMKRESGGEGGTQGQHLGDQQRPDLAAVDYSPVAAPFLPLPNDTHRLCSSSVDNSAAS